MWRLPDAEDVAELVAQLRGLLELSPTGLETYVREHAEPEPVTAAECLELLNMSAAVIAGRWVTRSPDSEHCYVDADEVLRTYAEHGTITAQTALRIYRYNLRFMAEYLATTGHDPWLDIHRRFLDLTGRLLVTAGKPLTVPVGLRPGDMMREAREAAGLTQRELAKLVDVNVSTVSRWELGVQTPGRRHRERLAVVFDTAADEFT